MKRILTTGILLLLVLSPGFSQEKPAGGFVHLIEVGSFPYFAPNYLVITNTNEIVAEITLEGKYSERSFRPYSASDDVSLGAIILEINGVSAEGMDKNTFYDILDHSGKEVSLRLRGYKIGRRNGDLHREYNVVLTPLATLSDDKYVFGGFEFVNTEWKSYPFKDQTLAENRHTKANYISRYDRDFDFSKVKTYDYVILSEDNPLLDKEIVDQLSLLSLKRDQENPDIVVSVTRNADESIVTNYVPPTSHVVNEGSVITPYYNYLTRQTEYITENKSRIVREGGYTVNTTTADTYLEITVLDASKLNDPRQRYAPVVWNCVCKEHFTNPKEAFSVAETIKEQAKDMGGPLFDNLVIERKYGSDLNVGGYIPEEDQKYVWAIPLGASDTDYWNPPQRDKWAYLVGRNGVLIHVLEGSIAQQMGLVAGDKYLYSVDEYNGKRRKYSTADMMTDTYFSKSKYESTSIVVSRNGKKLEFEVPAGLMTFRRERLAEPE